VNRAAADTVPAPAIESLARAIVARAELWKVADLARRFLLTTYGRLDAVRFHEAQERLAAALEELPRT
jgi:hypothetical protein